MKLGEPKYLSIRYSSSAQIRTSTGKSIEDSNIGNNHEDDSPWNVIWNSVRKPINQIISEITLIEL